MCYSNSKVSDSAKIHLYIPVIIHQPFINGWNYYQEQIMFAIKNQILHKYFSENKVVICCNLN